MRFGLCSLLLLALGGCVPKGQMHRVSETPRVLPGRQPDGSTLLPNQWSLRPAGRQIQLRDFPVNVAVHPSGRYAAVLHAGYSAHQISIIDLRTEQTISHANIEQTFYGLEFSRDGSELFCSGAGSESIHQFSFRSGQLTNHRQHRLRPAELRAVPAGIAISGGARNLYTADVWGDRVTQLHLGPNPQVHDILLRTNTGPLLQMGVRTNWDLDMAAALKRADEELFRYDPAETFPYACRLDERKRRLYVSLWAQSAVAVVDLRSNAVAARWPTEDHPCEMVLTRSGKHLFVANAHRNTVTVFDTTTGKTVETLWAALFADSPPGSTPNSLVMSPDEKLLFVANACNNAIAVFDVENPGRSRALGFIPAGWYPTSVRITPDGRRLLIANGKGTAPLANPAGPIPGITSAADPTVQYIGRLFRGSLSVVDLPRGAEEFDSWLAGMTAETYRCSPLRSNVLNTSALRPGDSPVPARVGDPGPIKYCIYIVKENRTYDQVLGDMREGNGDAKLCLFPEMVTPNHHKLAREFVLLDNFYVESEISADGHEWTMGAYASDFVEKTWPLSYGHNVPRKYPYPAEGNFLVARPANGYLWDMARAAGVSYRSYGEFVNLHTAQKLPVTTLVKSLEGHIDTEYHGFDLEYSDLDRTARFISELHRFEREGEMPRLQIVRLPNDHTFGSSPGALTPRSFVAQNDLAFGQMIEAVSHSKFWPETAVFVVEDDAQNGPDHVDAHRTIAFVISPYVKRKSVDSTLYSTCSMLRTMELILGLKPMSQFDAAARPMYGCFAKGPDLTGYTAEPARVSLEDRNSQHAWGGQIKFDFSKEDAADDLLLNEVIWRSVKGSDNPMPAPVRAGFIRTFAGKDADD